MPKLYTYQIFIYAIAGLFASSLLHAEKSLRYTFSGTITAVAPELSPRIAPTFVFSGSLQFTDREVDLIDSIGDDYVIYQNFIEEAEFTLDENYILQEEATLSAGDSRAEIINQGLDGFEPDMVKFLIPVEPPQARTDDYNATWLELFFYDNTRIMLSDTNLPRRELDYTSAGFRVSYFNKETQRLIFVVGVLDNFQQQAENNNEQNNRLALEQIIIELNTVILEQRQTVRELEQQLAAAKREIMRLQEALATEQAAHNTAFASNPAARELQANIDNLTLAIEEIETKEANAQALIQQLNHERSTLEKAHATMTQDLKEVSSSLLDARSEMKNTKKIIATLNREIALKDDQIKSIQAELATASTTVTTPAFDNTTTTNVSNTLAPVKTPPLVEHENASKQRSKTRVSKRWKKRFGPRRN